MRWLALVLVVLLFAAPVAAEQSNLYSLDSSPVQAAQEDSQALDYLSRLISPDKLEQPTFSQVQVAACCKTCRKGKACGNSCIARWKTCRKGPGCACDAN